MTVDKSESRVRSMFGEIAPRYDFLNHLLSLGVDHYWRWRTVRKVAPRGDGPILDLCTGTGDLAIAFLRNSDPSVKVIGADFCPEMLAIGRAKGDKCGANGRLSFVEADAQCLPFSDDMFQIVSVAFGLRNVTDTDQGLREMVRVCRPGGRVAILEFSQPRWQPFKAMYGWYFRHILPRIGQAVSRSASSAYQYLPESVGEFPAYEALLDRMREAGLKNSRYFPLTLGVATLYIGEKSN